MILTDSFELTSELAPWLLAASNIALVVLCTKWSSSLDEALLVAVLKSTSVLKAEVSVTGLPFDTIVSLTGGSQMSST
jgi:hypothetical protein